MPRGEHCQDSWRTFASPLESIRITHRKRPPHPWKVSLSDSLALSFTKVRYSKRAVMHIMSHYVTLCHILSFLSSFLFFLKKTLSLQSKTIGTIVAPQGSAI